MVIFQFVMSQITRPGHIVADSSRTVALLNNSNQPPAVATRRPLLKSGMSQLLRQELLQRPQRVVLGRQQLSHVLGIQGTELLAAGGAEHLGRSIGPFGWPGKKK